MHPIGWDQNGRCEHRGMNYQQRVLADNQSSGSRRAKCDEICDGVEHKREEAEDHQQAQSDGHGPKPIRLPNERHNKDHCDDEGNQR
jgi:hypothetical protein